MKTKNIFNQIWRSLKYFISIFGVLWLIIEPIVAFNPSILPSNDKMLPYYVLVSLSIIITIIIFLKNRKIRTQIESHSFEIEVTNKDIFDFKNLVIGTNDTFDTEIGGIIAANSLQGQFTSKIYNSDVARLDRDLQSELSSKEKYRIFDPDKVFGKGYRYPNGTTVCIEKEKRYYLLAFCSFDKNETRIIPVSITNIWNSLTELWKVVRAKNNLEELAIPIIGSIYGRTNMPIEVLLKIIILSFYSSSRESRICNKLYVCVHDKHYDELDKVGVKDFIKSLK